MRKAHWIAFTAFRYLLTKRKEKGHVAFTLSIVGIAVGIMTLITVLGVMNGFQQGYMSNINEIQSYHLRINGGNLPLSPEEKEEILMIKGIRSITAISETQTVIQTRYADPEGVFVRGIESSALWTDEGLYEHLGLQDGDFNLEKNHSIVIGDSLARKLAADLGDKVFLHGLIIDEKGRVKPQVFTFFVSGIFHSGYPVINRTMVFINLYESYETLALKPNLYGVKLHNHFHDRKIEQKIEKILDRRDKKLKDQSPVDNSLSKKKLNDNRVISWRDYNKSFYGALLAEKIMMIIVFSLIFIVVAVNLFQSLKRSVIERVEEIALIKAIGGSPFQVQTIFILEGIIISLLGGIVGTLGGLLLVFNINSIFNAVEWIVNNFISLFSREESRSMFLGSSFYLSDVPVEVMPGDVAVIVAIACISSIVAASLASFKLSQIKPAEVIHYE